MDDGRKEELKKLRYLAALEKNKELQSIEYALCKKSLEHWLYNWVWTVDTHGEEKGKIRRFPKKTFHPPLFRALREEKLLAIPKSRQIMITWTVLAFLLHDAMFNEGRLTIVQSKKAEDAFSLIGRIKDMYNYLPFFLKHGDAKLLEKKIEFPSLHSEIIGIPEGEKHIRMHTASKIFMDEVTSMDEAEDAYTAAKPSISSYGQIIMASSAKPGFFERLCNDKL